jgi:hypothetical protein
VNVRIDFTDHEASERSRRGTPATVGDGQHTRRFAIDSLAAATARKGDTSPALDYYEQAIRTWRQVGAWSPLWITLRTFIRVLADLDLNHDAATLHGATRRPRSGPAPYGADSAMMQETATTLLRRLGQDDFDAHVTHGADLADDEVVEFALQAVRRARDTKHGKQKAIGDHALNRP